MLVSVIILNWNGEALLREFLPQVLGSTDPALARVIVADNGSDDGSLTLLQTDFPQVEVMRFPENLGFAGGYNRALAAIDTEYTVLLNSDAAPAPGWLEPLVDFMESHPQAGICQPKLLSYNEKDTFEYAGACGGYLDKNGYPFCRGRIFGICEKDRGQYDEAAQCFWASGAAFMIRTQLYRDAGGLDERFFAHMEEIDLCWRVLLMGYEIWAVPQSIVYHLGGASLPASNPRKTYLNFRNSLLMMHKNLPDTSRSRKLLRRRLLDTLAWLKFALTLDFRNAAALWRAHRDFAGMRRHYSSHPGRDLLDERADTHCNILTDYYLKGRKTFSSHE